MEQHGCLGNLSGASGLSVLDGQDKIETSVRRVRDIVLLLILRLYTRRIGLHLHLDNCRSVLPIVTLLGFKVYRFAVLAGASGAPV